MELEKLSCKQLGDLVKSKQISPVEILVYFADRIESRNPAINAFVYTRLDEALQRAKEIEIAADHNETLGLFAGVPFALKDFLPSKQGWTHSYGGVKSLIQEDPYSSEFCLAMENMGGVAIGKTNAPSFGFRGTCDNKLYGPTHNPFNLKYNSGGSSGGSAAAVADGMIPIAEGGDAGGSIRVPAAWCNCFGFKPSAGAIPSVCRPDGWAATHPFCCNGGITRNVEDAAILFYWMNRYDPRDPYSVKMQRPASYVRGLERNRTFRIGVTADFDAFNTDPEIKEAIFAASKKLQTEAYVDWTKFNFKYSLDEMADAWCQGISLDTAIELDQWSREGLDMLVDHRDELPEEFIYWNEKASRSDVSWMYHFNQVRTSVLDAFLDAFRDCDLILGPVTACNPVKNTSDKNTTGPEGDLIKFASTFPINFIGFPAASIPVGYTKEGLPIGMQIIGKRYHDWEVLQLAKLIEDMMPWNYNKIPEVR